MSSPRALGDLSRLLRQPARLAAWVLVLILGLLLMKEGLQPASPFLRTQPSVTFLAGVLGFG